MTYKKQATRTTLDSTSRSGFNERFSRWLVINLLRTEGQAERHILLLNDNLQGCKKNKPVLDLLIKRLTMYYNDCVHDDKDVALYFIDKANHYTGEL